MLAIAGLIFLMIFIVIPALQRSQRNTQYKNNLSLIIAQLKNYKANNRGMNPPHLGAEIISVGTTKNSNHPFYDYLQKSGATEGAILNIDRATGNLILAGTRNKHFGRMSLTLDQECLQSSQPWEVGAFISTPKQGSVAAWVVLEEGDGLIYCENV